MILKEQSKYQEEMNHKWNDNDMKDMEKTNIKKADVD